MTTSKAITLVVMFALATVRAFSTDKPSSGDVQFELKSASKTAATIHWRITNNSAGAIFVFDFFLWGPALKTESQDQQVIFDTTPTELSKSCGPNRLAPVVLVVIGPGRSLEGDFLDETLRKVERRAVSMRIVAGSDPYSVVDEVRRLASTGRCDENPYNGILRWGTIIESNIFQLSDK